MEHKPPYARLETDVREAQIDETYDEPCPDCGEQAYSTYMVRNELWRAHTDLSERDRLIHYACFEQRLGRKIAVDDLTGAPINYALRASLLETDHD